MEGLADLAENIKARYGFLSDRDAQRLLRTYGTEVFDVLGTAQTADDLGEDFGAGIFAAELDWARLNEWVQTGEDFLWRRTKLGLRLSAAQQARVNEYLSQPAAGD